MIPKEINKKTERISSFSIIVLFTCLLILGLFFIPMLPVKLNPSKTTPEVSVSFGMYGQSVRVVEMEVTSKVEAMLNRVRGVKGITSRSYNGGGAVRVKLNKYIDPDMARFEISTIIRQTWPSLPRGVSYPSIYMSGMGNDRAQAFLRYTLHSPSSPIIIQDYADNNIKPLLSEIKGINKINISGASRMIRKLEYNYEQLQNLDISVYDIKSAIQKFLNKEFLGIGKIEDSGTTEWIRIALTPEYVGEEFDASKIQVINKHGKIVYLNQLVTSTLEEEEISSYFRINGLNTIHMSILAEEGANQLTLSKQIKEKLSTMALPQDYELHLSYDVSEYLQEELNKIYFRSGLTLLILICFVLLIYRNFKYSFLILFSLVTNISIALILYYLIGLEIHLYSLAGITISLTLIIDNTIVMSDQIIQRGNKNAFLAILTATLTTVASLVIIFFMDESVRINLEDFALVIIINLMISLFIALFLVPALIEKLNIKKRKVKQRSRSKRLIIFFNKIYGKIIRFTCRRKALVIVLLILAFGIPVYLLPAKIEKREGYYVVGATGYWGKLYNKTLGSTVYKEKIKPITDVALGGTMRLFVQKVKDGSYNSGHKSETSLTVTSSMPNGTTLEQIDHLIQKMERYIVQFPEVKRFETSINNARNASINIFFTKEHQKTSFPHKLKSQIVSRSTELGGGSWAVQGVGEGFNNSVREQTGSSTIKLLGYNYDELNSLAYNLKDTLLQHRRIKEIFINSEMSNWKPDYMEFAFSLNMEHLAKENIAPYNLFYSLDPLFERNSHVGNWRSKNSAENIRLFSKQSKQLDVWNIEHYPGNINSKPYELTNLAEIVKTQYPPDIAKENQQYKLYIQYEYIGNHDQSHKVKTKNMDEFNRNAPLGYKAEDGWGSGWWNSKDKKQYLLLLLIVIIIFFTTSILFNSLKQPFVVIFIIPISYIGIFLTFYLFSLNFDQGGFAAFILLSGITVNSNIYILNEYNIIKKRYSKISPMKAYLRAWNVKIRPIFLTVVSTILGFIPFMIGYKEGFWYPLAAGTIGGLIVSLIATFLFLPMFMGIGNRRKLKIRNK